MKSVRRESEKKYRINYDYKENTKDLDRGF
jgi:hypothetical protein